MFNSYSFGHIIFNEQDYPFDLVISTKGDCHERGPRGNNHLLEANELRNYLEPETKKLIVGTGDSGMLRVAEDAIKLLKSRHIELAAAPSAEAIAIYNSEPYKSRVTAVIHSTC